MQGFNPRPDRAAGATDVESFSRIRHEVSIRAPTVRPGRQRKKHTPMRTDMFQSAPRPCGRGDRSRPSPSSSFTRFNPRPDRAAGATRNGGKLYRIAAVSIRAPTVRPGRLGRVPPAGLTSVVSIRAPTVRPGRRDTVGRHARVWRFQSAPRPCGRGDRLESRFVRRVRRFQSAPRPCGRGDTRT